MPRIDWRKPPNVQPVGSGGAAATGQLPAVQLLSPRGVHVAVLRNTK